MYLADIAIKLFAKNGYATTSLQDIAKEAGISKAGLYHYFETKEDILYYALKNAHFEFLNALKQSMEDSKQKNLSPEESFRNLIYTYASFINNEKDFRLVVLQDRHQLTGENRKGLRSIERAILKTFKDQVTNLPGISDKCDPNVISFMIFAMSHWLGSWLNENGSLSEEDAIKQHADIILHGVFEQP